MIQIHGSIQHFSKEVKVLIFAFLCTLSIGFLGGITFVKETTNANPNGIERRYLGNENDENATKMMFKKSKGEVLTMVHNHILSLSVIFFLLGGILATTSINKKMQLIVIIEPFVSIVLTFGGIYLLWSGILWMKYVIMISGFLMTTSFILSTAIILRALVKKRT